MKRARAKNAVAAAATALQVAAAAVAVIVAVVTAAAVAAGANLAGSYLDFFDMGPRRICDAALFLVCRAFSTARGCKSPLQPDGGEVVAKRKGVAVR